MAIIIIQRASDLMSLLTSKRASASPLPDAHLASEGIRQVGQGHRHGMVGLTAVPGCGIHSRSPCLGLKDGTNHHPLVVGVQPHLTGLVQVELVDVWVLSAVHCLNGVGTREESGVVAAQGCRQRCAVDATRTVGGDGTIEHSKVHGTGLVVDVLRSNLNKGVFRDLEATADDDSEGDDDKKAGGDDCTMIITSDDGDDDKKAGGDDCTMIITSDDDDDDKKAGGGDDGLHSTDIYDHTAVALKHTQA